ncbi:helix-turn-helix domain-containing protein [Pseudomonas aestusnigri]|uniref:helix-turn-helix domain-containing protein n=1 Tax=Halopseudomonas aestusnigri TaxID=857252 RepID=UPI001D19163B|nr:helix-turn-helix domain-containing protein [Halopseudomonas aestusnigri]MCC4259212.1 helix-turn-helix domain-containing protein [Halopseudomonas aestusnigri]
MSKDNTRTSDSGARVLRVMKALKGHTLNGLSNGELAKALGESPANINRCLNTLIAEGLATRLDTGRFAPGMQLLQIAQATAMELGAAEARIREINQRMLAGAGR